MQEAFGIVIFVVVGLAAVVAVLTFATSGREYERIGRGGFSLGDGTDRPPTPAGGVPSAVAEAERVDEIRQLLEARNARRAARGEPPVDVEAELAALLRPRVDPALAAEVRELVEARNARRVRRGEDPLDVEAEVERQLRELGEDG